VAVIALAIGNYHNKKDTYLDNEIMTKKKNIKNLSQERQSLAVASFS
jgi:hypothetical protein